MDSELTMKNKKIASSKKPGRRKFLNKLWISLGALATAQAAWVLGDFLTPRKRQKTFAQSNKIVVAGPVEDFEPGSVTAFQQDKFYLVRLDNGGFLALSRVCTHMGCIVPWSEESQQFLCPCHGSAFSKKGEVLNSPALRPLDFYEIRIENNVVKVDVSKLTKRYTFSASQVVFA